MNTNEWAINRAWLMAKTFESVLERRELEDAWKNELKCESAHKLSGMEACTVEVTHLVTMRCRNRTFRVCTVSAAAERWNIEHKGEHYCGNFYGDCISVRPI